MEMVGTPQASERRTVGGLIFTGQSPESDVRAQKHDIEAPFESDYHPGLVVHDSEGFQAGAEKELVAFRKFLKRRTNYQNPDEQLHAIW